MDERNNLIILYDYYGGLLSDKQKEYFEQYYFENLSLSEMAENLNISRNAIHKVLKNINIKLHKYEEILKLKEKNQKLERIINKIPDENIKNQIKEIL